MRGARTVAYFLIVSLVIAGLSLQSGRIVAAQGSGDACNPDRPNDADVNTVNVDGSEYPAWVYRWITLSYPALDINSTGTQQTSQIGGVYANIPAYSGWSSFDTKGNSPYAWVMLTNDLIGSGPNNEPLEEPQWAQIGPAEGTGLFGVSGNVGIGDDLPIEMQWSYIDSNGNTDTNNWYEEDVAPGAVETYTVMYDNAGPGEISFVVGSTQQSTTPIIGWVPYNALASGETHDQADQYPGDVQYPDDITDIYAYANGDWSLMGSSALSGTVGYTLQALVAQGLPAPNNYNVPYDDIGPNNEAGGAWQYTSGPGGAANYLSMWDYACPAHNIAYQGTSGSVITETTSGTYNDLGLYMQPDTNASITTLSDGTDIAIAFQNSEGDLCVFDSYDNIGTDCTSLGMDSTTSSPSITATGSDSYTVAFRANSNVLWTYSPSTGGVDRDQGMMANTNPSITTLSNGDWQIAFQANVQTLYDYSQSGTSTNTDQGMNASSSPSIAGLSGGGWEAAFEANTDNGYVYSPGDSINTGNGMYSGTSPSITALTGGGWVADYEANTDELYTFPSSTLSGSGTGYYMQTGTSPSAAGTGDNTYWIDYDGQDGNIIDYTPSQGAIDLGEPEASGTSPGISP